MYFWKSKLNTIKFNRFYKIQIEYIQILKYFLESLLNTTKFKKYINILKIPKNPLKSKFSTWILGWILDDSEY